MKLKDCPLLRRFVRDNPVWIDENDGCDVDFEDSDDE